MSWQGTVTGANGPEFDQELDPEKFSTSPSLEEMSEEEKEQFDAGREAAVKIVQSGALGDPVGRTFGVNINGHANPDHAARENWSLDQVSVTVYLETLPATAADEATEVATVEA